MVLAQGTPLMMSGLRPVPPNLVYCGMMQCQPPKPLPQDLQKFMDDATEGVVYVSFGSVLQGSQVPKDKKDSLLSALGKLKEKVLMKWESDHLEGKPDNMIVRNFLPQQEGFKSKSQFSNFALSGSSGTSKPQSFCNSCWLPQLRGVTLSQSSNGEENSSSF